MAPFRGFPGCRPLRGLVVFRSAVPGVPLRSTPGFMKVLNELDDIEASSYYSRKQIEISLGTHRKACWIYEPDPESYSLHTLIPSGDWIEYAKTKTNWP